ncbi:hypothetical protein OG474_29090 [Kribbella sp. NBC_01505]|uniref:hypothetical protein n=1 Tax=Kribbella sp. NBC_01505 TaxID=2903580 RepID=UPI00386372EA
MTDLKHLLDDAAGPEPATTDTDLDGDLARGHRAVRRRRLTGIAAGTVATAAVLGAAWSFLPGGTTADTTPQVAATTAKPSAEPSAKPSTKPSDMPPPPRSVPGPLPPKPAVPVALVPNTRPMPGKITCDLIPQGWSVDFTFPGTSEDWEQKELFDPKLENPGQYRENSTRIRVRQSEMRDEGHGLVPDKYSDTWAELPHVRAGSKEAVISTGTKEDGLREVHVRQGKTARLVAVMNYTPSLGWDEATLLKFAGSCHYK